MSNITKTAMITICGRPNVGKSSLTNALVGEKVAIVSNKAQTTRNRIYGIVNRDDTQFILLDTPGLHRPKSALGDYMVKVVTSSLADVDCALLLVEPIPHVGGPEKALIQRVKEEKIPCILCINKIDTVEPAELLPVIAAYNEEWDGFDAIIPISAHSRSGLDDLMQELQKYAQEGPQLFPDGESTDQPERQVMGELLREKLLLCLDKEIPHGTAIEITKFSERDSGVVDVDATIHDTCENAGVLRVRYQNPRKNMVKVLLLMDSGGSMDYYAGLCSRLFQAATKSNHFKELHTYYFHNCIFGNVYEGPRLWQDGAVPTEWLLQNFDESYKVIIVGDAAMNPYELREKQYDWKTQRYGASGLEWLGLLKKHFPYLIWLNPEPMPVFQDFWTVTHLELAKMFPMFDLTAEGLEAGMKRLMAKR